MAYPRETQRENGALKGPITVSGKLELHGMVEGDATVATGGHLLLRGMVTGNLVVNNGARADVYGTVSGNVFNAGVIDVRGVVIGVLTSTDDATTSIAQGATVSGITH